MAVSASLTAHRTDPLDPASLIGRDGDTAWILERIHEGDPLIVLSGPAGVGKTALVARVAQAVHEPGHQVVGPTDVRSALRSVAASRGTDAMIGAVGTADVGRPVALQGVRAETRPGTSLVVFVDDYEPSPANEELLAALLAEGSDPQSQRTVVAVTRSPVSPAGAVTRSIEPVSFDVVMNHLARIGEKLDPPATLDERVVWANHLVADMSLTADLLRALGAASSLQATAVR